MKTRSPLLDSVVHKAEHYFGREYVSIAEACALKADQLFQEVARAQSKGQEGKLANLTKAIFHSPQVRMAALIQAYKPEDKLSFEQLSRIAADLSYFRPCHETIWAWKEPKSSGVGFRSLCEFGIRRRSGQLVVRALLDARFGPDPCDAMAKGQGCDRMSDLVVTEMQRHPTWICADIENFYGSVGQEGVVALLGLPKAVVANFVFAPAGVVTAPRILSNERMPLSSDEAVRLGLPQGSLVSPMIAGLLIGPTLRSLIAADQVRFYGDDILIWTSSYREAEKVVIALTDALKAHPAGPFPLRRCDVMSSLGGFQFAKYRFRAAYGGRVIRCGIAPRSRMKFRRKLAKIGGMAIPWAEKLKAAKRYGKRWAKSFPRAHQDGNSDFNLFSTTLNVLTLAHQATTGAPPGVQLAKLKRKLAGAIRGRKKLNH